MPDQSDVEAALASTVAGILYPDGREASAVVPTPCRVYRGWPLAAALAADLRGGVAHLAIQPVRGSVRDTTRYSSEWQGASPACPLVLETEDDLVRVSGVPGAGILAGLLVDGRTYACRIEAASTPSLVAAMLADMVRVDRPAELNGPTVRIAGVSRLEGRAVSDGQGGQELGRQEGLFRVSAWCPSPESRDAVCAAVALGLAQLPFLDVGGWGCRVRAEGGASDDAAAAASAFRRDLVLRIEWPTVLNSNLSSMLFGAGSVNGAGYVG